MREVYGSKIIKFLVMTMLQNILGIKNSELFHFTDHARADFFLSILLKQGKKDSKNQSDKAITLNL